MKGLLTILLVMTSVCFAQQRPVFDRAKKIKLLESSREDVIKLFEQENKFPYPSTTGEYFSFENEGINVTYSAGKCSDDDQDWNVREGLATEIKITPKYSLKKEDLGIDLTSFRKQRTDPQRKGIYALYDKPGGIAVMIHFDLVKAIYLTPTSREYSRLCDNAEVTKYYKNKRWTRKPVPKNLIIDYNLPAHVRNVTLTQIPDELRKFDVLVDALDPEIDVLMYNYQITGGRIIGVGHRVVWDLTDVNPGTYKITAGVDDGCGICGQYITKTVVIK